MTEKEAIERLRDAVQRAHSIRAFAKQHELTASYIHDVLNGRRKLSDRLANAIGLEKVVTVEYRETKQTPPTGESR